jgi:hypothetical protein
MADKDPAEVAREEIDRLLAAVQRLMVASTHAEVEAAHRAVREAVEPACAARHALIEITRRGPLELGCGMVAIVTDAEPHPSAWTHLKRGR